MKVKKISVITAVVVAAVLAAGVFFVLAPSTEQEAWTPGKPFARERLKIGVIYISDAIREKSGYSHAHEAGIRVMQRELGIGDDQIIHKLNVPDTDQAATEHAMHECIAAGADIIFATSWGYMDTCEKLAAEYPRVIFAHASGYKYNGTNFTNYFGWIQQARYLGGIVAGLRTVTGKIGYVGAMGKDNSEVTGGIDAFALGVESVNPGARVHVRITHRWFDPRGEIEAARALIAEGCDVIAQHCDTPGPQTVAQEAGVWSVGYNSDMRDEAPKSVITSVIWNWGVYYTRLVQDVIDGAFTTEPYMGGLGEGVVGLAPFNEDFLPAKAAEAVAVARKRIENEELHVFEGAMKTNDGRIVGVEGQRLSDSEILGGMNWYYHNVVESR